MQAGNKKGGKKVTKLSLSKRTQKSETSTDNKTDGIKNILEGNVDLNETCEFRQPVKFQGRGDSKLKSGKDRKIPPVTAASNDKETYTEDSDETVHCQVCKKNFSHMTLQCREQHVNRCIDRIEVTEKQQREEQIMLESARTAVLDCPMCGKHFKSENARVVHLKKCSVSVGVSTERMLQLVKDQEKARQEQVAAGIVPRELRSKVSKSAVAKKRKMKEPKSQFEEDVQVAMAISSSVAPEQIVMDGLSAGDNVKDGKRRKNKKTVLEDVCLLTTLTDEDRRKRMEEKIDGILQMANNDNFRDISLLDSDLKSGTQEEGHSLWKMCSRDLTECDKEQFYVEALIPPLSVSHIEPGKNLRRLSSIPGREKSFVQKIDNGQEKWPAGISNMSADDIITASTQTAVILAELAVDDTDIHDSIVGSQLTPNPEHTAAADLQASGFCVEKMVFNESDKNALFTQTLKDYKKMINSKEFSDVTVVSYGQTFFAHQVILAVRCPKLLQMMTESTIRLEVPPDIVLSFLNYIYAGDVILTSSAQSEFLKLAKQLELPTLIDACNKAVLHTETSDNFSKDKNIESSDTECFESQLDLKEIWGESDSDLDQDKGDQNNDKEGQGDSGINDDEYREISCTQKVRLRERIAHETDNNVESNEKVVISKHGGETCEDASSSNEIPGELLVVNDNTDQIDSDTDNSVKLSSLRKEKDLESTAHEIDGADEVINIDAEEEPKAKRMRLSSEKELAKADYIRSEDDPQQQTNKSINESVNKVNANHSNDQVSNSIIDEAENVDTTDADMNSSTADLFGSPTPKKSVTLTETGKITNKNSSSFSLQSNSRFSTPVEYKCDSKRTLSTGSLPVTPVVNLEEDSDSSVEEIDDFKEKASKHCTPEGSPTDNLNRNTSESSMQNRYAVESCEENAESVVIDMDAEKDIESVQQAKNSSAFDSSDDDLEITGDNFDVLTQHSPTFNHAKRSNGRKRFHVTQQVINATKYLGLKSLTEVSSGKTQINHSENDFNENESEILETGKDENVNDSVSYSKDIDTVLSEDNDVFDVSNAEPYQTKHLNDSASESEEIITIQTEDSDACDVQSVGRETDTTSVENYDLQSAVKPTDSDESNVKGNPERDVRRSAFYGKHEISVYSTDGNKTIACSSNQSFEENNTDVWDDFDDCGMTYEPPCRSPEETSPPETYNPRNNSPRETSPVIEYQQMEVDPGEASPITPEQSDIIDLSQTEDDSNKCDDHVDGELDDNLLEDGDDSFVFKVDDQPDIHEKIRGKKSKVKKTDFKTPTVTENRGKRKGTWVPPSPFTPMPQFGEMPTPALKKRVQKYGMKAVGKKRMVKVLEDIYQQTHQYETDSEFEGEDEGQVEAESGQVEKVSATSRDHFPSSQDDLITHDSDVSDLLEESCLHTCMSSDSDTSASPQKGIDLTKKLFDFVKSRPEIHAKILMYEPLELDVLKKDVKDAGIRCSMDKLMDFLDERCIAFTNKNSRKRQTGGKRGRKATKSKQSES